MNKQYLLLALLGLLNNQLVFGAAGYPKTSPLFNAAVAVNAETKGAITLNNFEQFDEFKDSSDIDSAYIGTTYLDVLITLVKCKHRHTTHIGIGVSYNDLRKSYMVYGPDKEVHNTPTEDLKFVHKHVKLLINKHGVTALDTMAATGIGGTLLSHLVHRFRTYYQKLKPAILTFNAEYVVRAPNQTHFAFNENFSDSGSGFTGKIYKPIKTSDHNHKPIFSHLSPDHTLLLETLADKHSEISSVAWFILLNK